MNESDLYCKVVDWIKKVAVQNGYEKLIPHFERTVYWTKQLDNQANQAQLISAFAHDAERVMKPKQESSSSEKRNHEDSSQLRKHQEESALIVKDFLVQQNSESKIIEEVVHLISRHEEGGDVRQNVLMDADSISFLETNIDTFLKKVEKRGKKQVREKFEYMFNRISSDRARQIALPLFEKAMEKLENLQTDSKPELI